MQISLGEFGAFVTLAGFFGYLSICAWAFAAGRQADFDAAAELPFNEPEELARQRRAMLLGR